MNITELKENYSKPRSHKVKKIMMAVKSFLGTISVATYFTEHQNIAFWILVLGAALDEISKLIPSDGLQQQERA